MAGLQGTGLLVDLSFNVYLTDISLLSSSAQYSMLNLVNDYLDLTTVPALQADTLLLQYTYGLESNAWLQTNPAGAYGIINCPMDKVVAMENLFGRGNVQFFEELDTYLSFLNALGIDVRYIYLLNESN